MTAPPASIGILGGTGPQGRGLGLRFALAGYRTTIGSRDAGRAAETVEKLTARHDVDADLLDGAANAAAASADVVIAAVPFDGLAATVAQVRPALDGKVVVSCVNRLSFDDAGPVPVPVDAGSAAELVARVAPAARVVGAFHHVPAGLLRRNDAQLDMDVLVVGDDEDAVDTVVALADALPGARGVRAGPLRLARPLEEFTAVVLSVNRRYDVAAGTRLAGLDDAAAGAG